LKLSIDVRDQTLEVEFDSANGSARLEQEGRSYEAQVSELEPGLFLIIFNNRVYRCVFDRSPDGEAEVSVNGQSIRVAVHDPRRRRGGSASSGRGSGPVHLTAPMAGKVVRLLRSSGDEVASGEGVLVVEAMKMQNEVQSPRAGKVAEIRVCEGQTVNAGEVLAVVE
jgi:biotin carboxyl carrier protein